KGMENSRFNRCWFSFEVLILLLGLASAMKYRLRLENEEIFTPCRNQPSNVKDIDEFFDFSEFQTKEVGDIIMVSGNLTSKWKYDPTDRLEASAKILRFERREWIPTIFSMTVYNLCSVLYDKRQHWYAYWTKYVVNAMDVKSKCLLNGTKFIHKPFAVDLHINLPVISPEGRHKLVIIIKTIDKQGKLRDPILCFDIIGDVTRS
ncbi:hypothetical protein KR044_006434, partial [Drosophila immigrans]